jgi:Sulfatase
MKRKLLLSVVAAATAVVTFCGGLHPAYAQQPQQKPNILFIMGDDIGWMQVGAYQQGMGVGETPNLDRLANEGAKFMTYYAEQSCTAGRNAFFTGMNPLRTGMIPPQLPGSPTFLQPGTPAVAKFLLTSVTTPANSARTISATTPTRCQRRTASKSSGVTSITWMPCNR